MTIRSKTYKGSGFNELKFDDATGKEQVYIHAQKNMNTEVLNNRTTDVINNHAETIGSNQRMIAVTNNQIQTVGVNQIETVGSNQIINVGSVQVETIGLCSCADRGRGVPDDGRWHYPEHFGGSDAVLADRFA